MHGFAVFGSRITGSETTDKWEEEKCRTCRNAERGCTANTGTLSHYLPLTRQFCRLRQFSKGFKENKLKICSDTFSPTVCCYSLYWTMSCIFSQIRNLRLPRYFATLTSAPGTGSGSGSVLWALEWQLWVRPGNGLASVPWWQKSRYSLLSYATVVLQNNWWEAMWKLKYYKMTQGPGILKSTFTWFYLYFAGAIH